MTIDDIIKEESRIIENIDWRLNKNYDNWFIQYNEKEKRKCWRPKIIIYKLKIYFKS